MNPTPNPSASEAENPPASEATLRDLFAMKAMTTLISMLPNEQAANEMRALGLGQGETDKLVAKCAYDYADAMLRARKEQP